MKKIILAMVVFAAFIFVVGSVGAFDNSQISFFQCAIQCAIGIGITWIAFAGITKKEEK
jgi:hypothetical protein